MIVRMKKMTLLISRKEERSALGSLRKLGVLHVQPVQSPQSEEIDQLNKMHTHAQKAVNLIADSGLESKKNTVEDVEQIVLRILDLDKERRDLRSKLNEKDELRKWFADWGDFSFGSVQTLKQAGYFIRLYQGDKNALKLIPKDYPVQIVKEQKGVFNLALFSRSEEERFNLKEFSIPPLELSELIHQIQQIRKRLKEIDKEWKMICKEKAVIETYISGLENQLEFYHVLASAGKEEQFVYLQGFCPYNQVDPVKKWADQEGWGTIIEDPDNPDDVPTLIRNPKWLRMVDPLFKFMGTIPGYHEKDISFWFLLFFSLFFAMLIGDAGYGLLFLGLAFFRQKKWGKHHPKEPYLLIYTLSIATLIWGILSGTWFGYPQIAQLPFLNQFIIKNIDSFSQNNSDFMMHLCFIIGFVHLSVAHFVNAIHIINSPRALGELGWIGILWALFFLVESLVIGRPLSGFATPLFIGGVTLTLVFSNFQKNIIKGILSTFGNLPLSIIGSFSDIVSYLRLFAVGYATVVVASSFNDMAIRQGFHNVVSGVAAVLILFLGHGLNILLGFMSVIVHGIRLNMLEFSGHLGMQWSGKLYQPFHERERINK